MARNEPILQVDDLQVHFNLHGGFFGRRQATVKAVDGVSFSIGRGETLGVVGESGCGKSTTGLAVLRMVEPTGGTIRLDGADVTQLRGRQLQGLRRRMQMVYQDPFGALDPRMRVLDIVGEPLAVHKLTRGRGAYRARVLELLDVVGLSAKMAERYPHEFSGGQRQRIGIARALAAEPELIVCDEPVSALDVSIQAQIINLLQDLQAELGLSYLFIAHDLAVVRHICDRIMVMYLGQAVETAPRDDLYQRPLHPYTQALLSAVPVPDPGVEVRREVDPSLQGEVPSPVNPPKGCPFHPRCRHAHEACRMIKPPLRAIDDTHAVACHLYDPAASEVNVPLPRASRAI